MVRPERFELPACCFGGNRSIQLSYGRILAGDALTLALNHTATDGKKVILAIAFAGTPHDTITLSHSIVFSPVSRTLSH
jgi:hypothetical protein